MLHGNLDANGDYAVPAGKIVSVVTHLEMREPPPKVDVPARPDLDLRRVPNASVEWYRALYTRVGAEWLWFSRLELDDAHLANIIRDPLVEVYALTHGGEDAGLLELDRRTRPDVELAFFGLVPELVGGGAGRWLMARAIERAFERPIGRLHLHTCTLDHPAALSFYLRSGFRAFARSVEVVDDPRLRGVLAPTVAAHHPVIEPDPA